MRRLAAHLCLALPLALPATAAAASGGGAPSVPPPSPASVTCAERCLDGGVARQGSKVVVRGTSLDQVTVVTFKGSALAGDEASVRPVSVSARRLVARVPGKAYTGPLSLTDGLGQVSADSPVLQVFRPSQLKLSSGPIATSLSGRRAFIDGTQKPTLAYRLQTDKPAAVTVKVVSAATQAVVRTYDEGTVDPGVAQAVAWDGQTDLGKAAGEGRYAFVVSAASGDASAAQNAAPADFVLLGHMFPIRGAHSYGDGAGRFGAGRTGHTHQGQDVFAKCGTPLVAARGGVVKTAKWQAAAGNFIVIDHAGEGTDTFYAHMRDPALVQTGDRVRTGQPIGFVGDTGDAVGCHLHFEEWSAPGWYSGGSPFDPLPDLQAWDALS